MRGFHFSLRWLFGVVSFLAVSCGLLIYASPLLSKLTFTAALVLLLASMFPAVFSAADRRAFWAGFAVFGFAYIWLICGAWQAPDGSALRDRLATTAVLEWTHDKAARRQTVSMPLQSPAPMAGTGPGMSSMMGGGGMPGGMMSGMGGMMMGPMVGAIVNPEWNDFLTTGHSLFAILFACLGGVIAKSSYRRAKSLTNPI